MAHEKVFGFCENLCEVEVEKTSNKVTSMSSSSTHDEYPSAKAVYDTFEKTSNKVTSIESSSTHDEYPSAKSVYDMSKLFSLRGNNLPWRDTLFDCAMWYFYEGADTTLYYLPTPNCIVIVFQQSPSRGVAFAFGWDGVSTNKTVWKNTCQDAWRGWTSLHSN